jgi:hypothetical protein
MSRAATLFGIFFLFPKIPTAVDEGYVSTDYCWKNDD